MCSDLMWEISTVRLPEPESAKVKEILDNYLKGDRDECCC